MKKNFYSLFLALLALALPAQAETWTYDFESFSTDIDGQGPRKAIEANLNGLEWHMYGVRSNADGDDYHDGQGSMRIYGEVGSVTKPGNEITNFTLMTPRSIGTVSFTICAHAYWSAYQVEWILQASTDGETWTTIGNPFMAQEEPERIERTVNYETGYIRIVRADYATYDLTKQSSYSYITNIDNFSITDAAGDPVVLQTSVSQLDFGTLKIGEQATQEFTLSYSGIDTDVKPFVELAGVGASAFSLEERDGEKAGERIVSVTCTANQRGDINAAVMIDWYGYSTSVKLVAKAEKDENMLFSGGQGTAEDPYRISCASDLLDLSYSVEYEKNTFEGQYFIVTNDFSMSSAGNFRPIGNNFGREGADAIRPFSGTFDGDGHTISDISVSWDSYGFAGLFGIISGATVKNLTVSKSSFYAGFGVAAIAGAAIQSTISNCHTTGSVKVDDYFYYAAGICAGALNAGPVEITDCTNAATVSGEYGYTAGILATSSVPDVVIARCGNTGSISDNNLSAAGIVCSTTGTILVQDCYNTGDVTINNLQDVSNAYAAGILATLEPSFSGKVTIRNCYNTGAFNEVAMNMAPIFPYYLVEGVEMSIKNCYYAADINTYPYAELDNNPIYEVEGMNYSEMKNAEFALLLNGGGEGVWNVVEGVNEGLPVPTDLRFSGIRPVAPGQGNGAIRIENGRIVVEGACDQLSVYDLNGRLVPQTEALQPGVYVVRAITRGHSVTRKVCVAK